jgi:predicted PurR-regulated permease PerM
MTSDTVTDDPDVRDPQPAPATPRVSLGTVFRWAAAATLGALVVLAAGYGLYIVRSIVTLVVISLFLAISLDPVVRFLVRRRVPRPAAVALVVLLLVGVVAVFVWSIVPPIIDQGSKLFDSLPGYLDRLFDDSHTIGRLVKKYNLGSRLDSFVADLPTMLAGGAVDFFQQFIDILVSSLTVFVLTIYFLVDLPRLRRSVVDLFPRRRERVSQILDVVVEKVGGYMIGNIAISIVAGILSFAALEVIGVPYALPLAATVAATDLIPMVGATLGATVCVLVATFTIGFWPGAVIVALFFVCYQPVENYLVAPRIYRNTVDLPSVVILLAALIGASLLGLPGAIMAIPVAATIKVTMTPVMASRTRIPTQ